MSRTAVIIIYNLLLPVFFLLAFPAWMIKMWRRGGYGTGLMQRLGRFKKPAPSNSQGGLYIHAVSVGEVLIAIKLIKAITTKHPELPIVLAATTSTGHDVAGKNAPDHAEVIYSPVDFRWIVRKVLRRYQPRQIVLIEAEAWPNLLSIADAMNIPVSMVNARLSARSEARFKKFSSLIQPIFKMVGTLAVQNETDAQRYKEVGIDAEKIHVTGSIKFDPSGGAVPQQRDEFAAQLRTFRDVGRCGPVVLIASTHAGEEKILVEKIIDHPAVPLVLIVPRHAERRSEVVLDLQSLECDSVLRSDFNPPQNIRSVFVADTTGELRDWTAHADIVIIGKSWLGYGGQNPAEAIAAGIPVITGPHMENFEPLVSKLKEANAIVQLDSAEELCQVIDHLLKDEDLAAEQTQNAREVLNSHAHAVEKTIELLYL